MDASRLFASQCRFVAGATDPRSWPVLGMPEVAFTGRSNVGKSTLVNALTGRRHLARISRTPGRTRQINFFSLAEKISLVDLPGYGYAKTAHRDTRTRERFITAYWQGRVALRRVYILVDCRRGVTRLDQDMMAQLGRFAHPYRLLLTKADKVASSDLPELVSGVCALLKTAPAALPEVWALSARKGQSLEILRADIASLLP